MVDLGAYENYSSLGLENISRDKFSIYPNPVKDIVKINSSDVFKKVEIRDSMGRLVRSQNILNNSFNMNGVSAGIYIVYAFDESKKINFKVIKE